MKLIIKICIVTFFLSLIMAFLLIFSFMDVFYEFELVSAESVLYTSIISSIVLAMIFVAIAIGQMKTEKKTRFSHWININASKVSLIYLLLILFFISIDSEVFLSTEEMKSIISLEWTILGISIAVFLIWNVLMLDYLKKKMPTKPNSDLPTKKWCYLHDKEVFYSDATLLLDNVYLVVINLIGVAIATVFIYISSRTATVFSQSFVIFMLFMSTNTIIGLVLDIIKPFNEQKKRMLEEAKTTSADIELQNEIDDASRKLLISAEAIDELNIDSETKTKLKSELLENYIKKYKDNSGVEISDKGEENDQL